MFYGALHKLFIKQYIIVKNGRRNADSRAKEMRQKWHKLYDKITKEIQLINLYALSCNINFHFVSKTDTLTRQQPNDSASWPDLIFPYILYNYNYPLSTCLQGNRKHNFPKMLKSLRQLRNVWTLLFANGHNFSEIGKMETKIWVTFVLLAGN